MWRNNQSGVKSSAPVDDLASEHNTAQKLSYSKLRDFVREYFAERGEYRAILSFLEKLGRKYTPSVLNYVVAKDSLFINIHNADPQLRATTAISLSRSRPLSESLSIVYNGPAGFVKNQRIKPVDATFVDELKDIVSSAFGFLPIIRVHVERRASDSLPRGRKRTHETSVRYSPWQESRKRQRTADEVLQRVLQPERHDNSAGQLHTVPARRRSKSREGKSGRAMRGTARTHASQTPETCILTIVDRRSAKATLCVQQFIVPLESRRHAPRLWKRLVDELAKRCRHPEIEHPYVIITKPGMKNDTLDADEYAAP